MLKNNRKEHLREESNPKTMILAKKISLIRNLLRQKVISSFEMRLRYVFIY